MPAKRKKVTAKKSVKPNRKTSSKKHGGSLFKIIGLIFGVIVLLVLYLAFFVPQKQQVSNISSDTSLGTFSGKMPCADCEGINTSITFHLGENDDQNTYTETDEYIGKGVVNDIKGTWSYTTSDSNPSAVIIELLPQGEGEGEAAQPQYYLVVDDNTIKMLNSEKQEIDSPFNETLTKE